MAEDRRLIEDYLPIKAISAEASREKSVRKGHIATLHLWWARRPLVACRAAVYGALVPASRFTPPNATAANAKSLGRANAAKFVERLCKYPGDSQIIAEAEQHILEAHAERLSAERGEKVTVEDIRDDRAPRPRVLDMFAGGGAIPLEALRLGCETYALDLNPVAHIIELCTLVYPQKYGKPDPAKTGMSEPKNAEGKPTWGGLAEEVRYWGNWVLARVKAEIGDLYPLIPDPESETRNLIEERQPSLIADDVRQQRLKTVGQYLTPVAYLWTRTVPCKNPGCKASVPLVKQTWLCRKEGRYVALRVIASKNEKRVRFKVVEAQNASTLGFDPDAGSKGGNVACPFCGAVADNEYVKAEGRAGRLGDQPVAVVVATAGSRGWVYLSADEVPSMLILDEKKVHRILKQFCENSNILLPNESIANLPDGSFKNSLGIRVRPYGFTRFVDLFSARQLLFHLHTVKQIRDLASILETQGYESERRFAIQTMLACVVDRATDFGCKLCVWNPYKDSGTTHAFGRQTITMIWDYSEVNPFNTGNASWSLGLDRIVSSLGDARFSNPGTVYRGSATALPFGNGEMDAVICDPPYYDNVPYSDISDFFYVWLNRTIGSLYPAHFATPNTPKKSEAIADADRHGGDKEKAKRFYEEKMAQAFAEANRVLKPGGVLAIVQLLITILLCSMSLKIRDLVARDQVPL